MSKRSKKQKAARLQKENAAHKAALNEPASEVSSAPPPRPAAPPGAFRLPALLRGPWAPLLLGVLAFVVYWPSLRSGFVYDANIELFEENFIPYLSNLPAVLTLKVMTMPLMLADRPGQLLFLMLICAVCGKHAFGYHLCSNLLHAANVALFFVIARRLLAAELTARDEAAAWKMGLGAAAVTLLFMLHPIVTEPVAVVNYSSDLQVAFFTFLALIVAVAFRPERPLAALMLGAAGTACAFAAVACKESGLSVAILLPTYWFLYRRAESRMAWSCFLGAAAAVTLAFLAARFIVVPVPPTRVHFLGDSFSQVFLLQPGLWVYMMSKLIWPFSLSADYTFETLNVFPPYASIPLLLVVVALQVWLAWKSRMGALGFVMYWAALITVSNFFPLTRPLADRFYYVPLAGVGLELLALLMILRKSGAGFWCLLGPLAAVLPGLCWLSLERQSVFANDFNLWTQTLEVSPTSSIAANNLGNLYLHEEKLDEAEHYFRLALTMHPHFVRAENNMGIVMTQRSRWNEAMAYFRDALAGDPELAQAHGALGLTLENLGRHEEAIAEFNKAMAINPRFGPTHFYLGKTLLAEGKTDEAIAQFREALELDSMVTEAQTAIGNIFMQEGRFPEAEAEFAGVTRSDPEIAGAWFNLANALTAQGKIDEALQDYHQALALNPKYAEAYNNLGIALGRAGRIDEAIAAFESALRINPNSAEAQKNLAHAQELKKQH